MEEETKPNSSVNPDNVIPIVDTPEAEAPIAKTLEKPFNLFAELNTVITYKDDFKPEQLVKKTNQVISALLDATGIELPQVKEAKIAASRALELEGLVSGKDAELTDLKGKLDASAAKEAEFQSKLSELEARLAEFKGLQIGKNKKEPEHLNDPMDQYNALIADNKIIEASRYAREHGLFHRKSK